MKTSIWTGLAKNVALSFARAFVATLIVGLAGLSTVPSFSAAKAVGLAAVVAAVTAGIRAAQHVIANA